MSEYLMEMFGYNVQGTADWRREKAEQFPRDAARNLQAAEELDRLTSLIEQVADDSPVGRRYGNVHERLSADPDGSDIWMSAEEDLSAELRGIGFHTSYATAEEFLNWYCDLLEEKLQEHRDEGIEDQVNDDPAVKAAEQALAEAERAVNAARARARPKVRARQIKLVSDSAPPSISGFCLSD